MPLQSRTASASPTHLPADDRCHVFHLGLPHREVLVLESLFRLHADLQQRYAFAPTSDFEPANILFVNGDDAAAVAEWHAFRTRHPESVAVMVCTNPQATGDAVTLTKPLSFRHLEEVRYALRAVTPTEAIHPEEEGGLRVLVVDDSATAREVLQAYLAAASNGTNTPVHVDFATSGEDALAKADDKRYDLVFLDVVMPGLDGYEVCRQLKKRQKARVAMLSGRREAVDYELGRAAGCDHYLTKPAPVDMVSTVIRLTALKKALPAH